MHAGRMIATQRLGRLPQKATHCHPFYENCAHLVTQLSYTKLFTGVPEERIGGRGRGPSDMAGIEKRAVQCRIRNGQYLYY